MPEKRTRVNNWISGFQRRREAWSISTQILSREGLSKNAYFFAAHTLKKKVFYDFHDLQNADQRAKVKQLILSHAIKHTKDHSVRMQLALCVAGIAIHLVGTEWKDALKDIVKYLAKPATAILLLDILTVLPEEWADTKLCARDMTKRGAGRAFSRHTDHILGILTKYLHSARSNTDLQIKVFNCFLRWVKHGEVSPQALVSNPLFQGTFKALGVEALFSVAADVLTELIVLTSDIQRYRQAVNDIIPKVIALRPKFQAALQSRDDSVCRSLANVFSALGERYMPFILTGNKLSQQAIRLLLATTAHPDKSVSATTFDFWYSLSKQCQRGDGAAARRQMYAPTFQALVRVIRKVMEFPQEIRDLSTTREKEINEYKRIRYMAGDTLRDAADVIGVHAALDMLRTDMVCEAQRFRSNTAQWHGLEATLQCMRSVAKRVDMRNENKVIPEMMKVIVEIGRKSPALRYTGTLIIGRFADWLRAHPNYLWPLVKFTMDGLAAPSTSVVRASSLAFKYICSGCKNQLCRDGQRLESLFTVYGKIGKIQFQDQKEIIEALTSVVGALPVENGAMGKGMVRLVAPIHSNIKRLINRDTKMNGEIRKRHLCHTLDLLSQILMTLPTDNDGQARQNAIVLKQVEQALDQAMLVCCGDHDVIEKVCRCWKYGVRASKLHFEPMLRPLLKKLLDVFPKHPHASFLYIMGVCVDEFGDKPRFETLMAQSFEHFSVKAMGILRDANAFVQRPDVAADFYDMVCRYLKRCPNVVFEHRRMVEVFQCALCGIGVAHKDACSMLMQFFEDFIRTGVNIRANRRSSEIVRKLQLIMNKFGLALVRGLLRGVAGGLPPSLLSFVASVIEVLVRHCSSAAKGWFQEVLTRFPETENPSRSEFVRAVFESRVPKQLRDAVRDYSRVVRARIH